MLKRIITGVVALPVVIFLIHQGGYLFDAAVFALATVGLFELRNMARANGHDIYWLSTGITAICLIYTASVFRVISVYSFILLPAFLMLGCILVLLEGMARHHNDGKWAFNTALSVMAVVYIGFGFAHFILLRDAMYFTSADLQVSLWVCLLTAEKYCSGLLCLEHGQAILLPILQVLPSANTSCARP